jgi:hypothetical protein
MTIACPFCKEATPEDAPACPACRARLARPCPYCAEEIPILARRCRLCEEPLGATDGEEPAARLLRGSGLEVVERDVVRDLVLCLVTLGLYGAVVAHRVARDLNHHAGREALDPDVDAALYVMTLGFWSAFITWRYLTLFNGLERAEGVPSSDLLGLCTILSVVGLGFVSLLILQDQLNLHWRLHR